MKCSKGSVGEDSRGTFYYNIRVNGKRKRVYGFPTKAAATKALKAFKDGRTIKPPNNRNVFWTPERLAFMHDEILPRCTSMVQAYREARDKWKQHFNENHFCNMFTKKYGIGPSKRLKARASQTKANVRPEDNPVLLRREIASLKHELSLFYAEEDVLSVIKSELGTLRATPIHPPDWLVEETGSSVFHGVPTLFISDIHHGEIVLPEQVNYTNEFNMAISRARLERIFKKTIYLLESVLTNAEYPGIVLAFGGDLLSGNIHQKLKETNEVSVFLALLDLAKTLVAGINLLKARFGKVFIPWVVGNHGRMEKKPQAKNRVHENYEYMLMEYVIAHFVDADGTPDPDVQFLVGSSDTITYKIYGTRYLLTHGDQFRGGSGISGPILPWTLGEHRMRKQAQTMAAWNAKHSVYDIMMFGHWHTFFPTRTFIVNGSVKGFDEYAKSIPLPYEPAQQALWLTNPKHGMTLATSVFGDSASKVDNAKTDWISVLDTDTQNLR